MVDPDDTTYLESNGVYSVPEGCRVLNFLTISSKENQTFILDMEKPQLFSTPYSDIAQEIRRAFLVLKQHRRHFETVIVFLFRILKGGVWGYSPGNL